MPRVRAELSAVGPAERMSKTPLRAVRVDPELWEKARTIADKNDDNLSRVIRDALRDYIQENEDK